MLSLLERSRYSICCKGVSSVICSITSLGKLELCVCVCINISKKIPKHQTNLKIKTNKTPCLPIFPLVPLQILSRNEHNFHFAYLTAKQFSDHIAESVLLISPLSCFLASFPLLCCLFFLSVPLLPFLKHTKKKLQEALLKITPVLQFIIFPSA